MTHKEVLQLLLVSLFYSAFTLGALLIAYGVLTLLFWGPKVIFSVFLVIWACSAWLTRNPNDSWTDSPKVRVLTRNNGREDL